MRMLVSRLPLRRVIVRTNLNAWRQVSARCRSNPADPLETCSRSLLEVLPELPTSPCYPCPFLTTPDVEKYLVPLYRTGWGISRTPTKASATKIVPPATQLSKRVILRNPDIAGIFMKDILSMITQQENHHPAWDEESDPSNKDIHIHTHTAIAPADRQNADDQGVFTRKRPGITHRDIRFAILFERLLRDYIHQRLLEPRFPAIFPQPTEIEAVHNFGVLSSQGS